jgi:Zn-dependent peptidase ImmA (M78 family)/transcriptional regulator with XRE-family HTH domain
MSTSNPGDPDLRDDGPFTPSRLELARRRRGMTLVDLAEATGISRKSLTAYEHAEQVPGPDNLQAVATALDMPPDFFVRNDLDEVPLEAVSFRRLSKMTARQRDMALSSARMTIELGDWIEQHFVLPDSDVPTLDKLDPETAAETVRARWGLGQGPISNMVHLLEAHGIRVFSLTEECIDVDAFSLYWKGTPYVFLNTRKSGERGRFDAAHELGHLVLHSEESRPCGPEEERQAHRFAAAFLMPRSSILAQGLRNAPLDRVLQAKATWKVAAMALMHRVRELGLSTDWHYRTSCIALSKMGYRKGEPDGIPREASQALQKVLALCRERGISLPTIAEAVGVTPKELSCYVFGLTPTIVNGRHATAARRRSNLTVVRS